MNVNIGGIAQTVEITSFDKLGDVKICMLTTTQDNSVGFEQLNDEVRDTIYASFPVDTADGNIATFPDGADNVPVRQLTAYLEPYQNLNGYDHPWVGGAGKNKLPITISSQTYNDITLTVNANGSIKVNGTASALTIFILTSSLALPDGTYVINGCPGGGGSSTYRLDVNDGSIGQDTGGSATFNVSGGTGISNVRLRIASGCTVNNLVFWPMIRIAGQSNTFEPYENICPIYPNNGKNLYDSATKEDGYISATGTVTVDGSSVHSALIPVTPNQPIVFSGLTVGSGSASTKRLHGYNSSGTWVQQLGYASSVQDGTRYTISATVPSGITGVKISFRGTDEQVQVEHGTSPSAYVPYNAIGITRTGKNLWSLASGGTASTNFIIPKTALPTVIPIGTYCLSFNATIQTAAQVTFRDSYDTTITSVVVNANQVVNGFFSTTVTLDRIACVASIYTNGTSTLSNIQVEKGSSATQYEPYTAERYYPISDNPVYGGTLDVATGLLTVDRGYVELDGQGVNGFSMASTTSAFYADGKATNGNPHAHATSNMYEHGTEVGGAAATTSYPYKICTQNLNGTRFLIYDPRYTTANAFNTYLGSSPLQIVYQLASPVTYQLTGTQVKTLLGYNNIWTDNLTVDVQYRANIGLYIQKIIGVSEDDMIANTNIPANTFFFINEVLYYSTTAIASGATIIPGTNCTEMTLADALNALNT